MTHPDTKARELCHELADLIVNPYGYAASGPDSDSRARRRDQAEHYLNSCVFNAKAMYGMNRMSLEDSLS
jgi:hypothetical protein